MTADLGSAATIGLRKISEIDRLLWTLGVLAVAAVAYVYGLKLNTNGYWIGVIPFGGPTPSEFRNMPEKYFAVLTRCPHRRAND
jgi:hypothetical protein